MPKANKHTRVRQVQLKRPERVMVLRDGKTRMMDRDEYEASKEAHADD